MTIIINWQNCTRQPHERMHIERSYKKRLVELCNSEEHAKALHDEHVRNNKPPHSCWARFSAVAGIEATAGLLPSERRDARFTVRFEG